MAKFLNSLSIGSFLLALLTSPLATAAGIQFNENKASYPNINPKIQSLPNLKNADSTYNLKDKEIVSESVKLRAQSIVEKLKMKYDGGSDSGGGGGQGVYDMRTGQVRFVDILSKEELQQMQLATNPQQHVFARFPKCTKRRVLNLPKNYQIEADSGPNKIFVDLEPYLGFFSQNLSTMTQVGLWRLMTALRLNQLQDATSIAPEYQIQLAIYKNGISYFQKQALALMPFEDFKWLLIKEVLRYTATYRKINASNAEIEEVLRYMYQKNGPAVVATPYFLKLMRPNFEMDLTAVLLGKKELIERRLNSAGLSHEERELWESDLADIQFKESKDFEESLVPKRLKLNRKKMNFFSFQPVDKGGEVFEESHYSGFTPDWAVKSREVKNSFENCSKE